ncbi:MAG: hypothetical protein JWQ04_952 [Pedosphaera sp.]|nr:hypothetical protein [Pedosphaera sp.]
MCKQITALRLILIVALLAGCGTKSPLVNWDRRMGNYSYDLALQDLGVPLRSTTLGDGSIVADWRTREGKPATLDVVDVGEATGAVPPIASEGPNIPPGLPPTPDHYLRLTFGPDQKLTGWRKYSQWYETTGPD